MATATKTRTAASSTRKPASKPATKSAANKSNVKNSAKSVSKAPAKGQPKPTAKKSTPVARKEPVYPSSIQEKKAWGSGSKINRKTGFTEGTISDKIAMALIRGGASRAQIVRAMDDLPQETKKGTKFQAANVAATVERQMRAMGFEVVQQYKLVPPKRTRA